jgi:Recombination endonuclease VII
MASNARQIREVAPGTAFGTWVVIQEVERGSGHNRRFLCHCEACGLEQVKFLSNLTQGKGCKCLLDYVAISRAGREKAVAQRRAASQVGEDGRICLTCGERKPWDEFYGDPRAALGRHSNCIDCASMRSAMKAFGLTRAEIIWLSSLQDNLCALCGSTDPDGRRLAVDHDHACCGTRTGCKRCIRGLLCGICNRLLGHVETKPELVSRFADYLSRRPFASVLAGDAEPVLEDVALFAAEEVA